MYLRKLELQNIKMFEHLVWDLPEDIASAGWHVVIGDNASGKTTVLRCFSMSMIEPINLSELPFPLLMYRRHVESDTFVGYVFGTDPSSGGRLYLGRNDDLTWHDWNLTERPDFFAASFGALRRFSGRDALLDRLIEHRPQLSSHLSLFLEDAALTEIAPWLETLQFEKLERGGEHPLLDDIVAFVNQPGLLPHEVTLDSIGSKGVFFKDGEAKVPLMELSDGFRSVLCLALEVLRQMTLHYDEDAIFERRGDEVLVKAPGVVLIDEVDAHLHPTWQQEIGFWLTRYFPAIQFIVTTHSPLVCQAAAAGSVFRLPRPRSGQEAAFLEGVALQRLLHGNVLDAYGTEAFGRITRSPQSKQWSERLAQLNMLALDGELTDAQQTERETLRARLPTEHGPNSGLGLLKELASRLPDVEPSSGE
jgi:energy-coupling factor transporter ATP-binding protein EcfA2